MTRSAAAAAVVFLTTACTVHKQETPSLTGPSELGKSISITVNPDILSQDGQSQSVVSIDARDASGQPLRSLPLRVDVAVDGAVTTTLGTLSARSLVTDGAGHASAVYTAPPLPGIPVAAGVIQIQVTPSEGDFGNSTPRSVSLRLVVPPTVVVPPTCNADAKFTFSPSAPTDHQTVLFDASQTVSPGGAIVNYSWHFGDGGVGSGRATEHSYEAPGTYSVTLTATDAQGTIFCSTLQVSVSQGQAPSAVFTTSPSNPVPNSDIFFNASQSKPAPGRTIVSYTWDFGDGTPQQQGVQVSHRFTNPGSYVVTLVVVDDAGNRSVSTNTVSVSAGAPIADFTFVVAGTSAVFNSSPSTPAAGRTLVAFSWVFDDPASGLNNTSALANPGHSFTNPGRTYNVTLTVTDDVGRTGTVTKQVTIP
ncbi:MAG TPA: PKD domain-containing protein [Vicinamibacterales bacterium]